MDFLRLFTDNLLPIFMIAGAGFLLAGRVGVAARTLNHVAFYVLAPCLVFQLIVDSRLPAGALIRMLGFSITALGVVGIAAAVTARLLGWSRSTVAAVAMVALLPNAGNYGLSATLFAFGEPGLAQASVFFIASSILSYTAGVFIASMGRRRLREALFGLVKVPAVWAIVVAFLMLRTDGALPFPAARAVKLLADACIPVFLLVLGMQLRGARWRGRWGPIAAGVSMRMAGGIAAGFAFAWLFGLDGVARQAGIFQSAMPSAVITIILATEYDVEPEMVTSAVTVTTLLSPLTLTPLLWVLGA